MRSLCMCVLGVGRCMYVGVCMCVLGVGRCGYVCVCVWYEIIKV